MYNSLRKSSLTTKEFKHLVLGVGILVSFSDPFYMCLVVLTSVKRHNLNSSCHNMRWIEKICEKDHFKWLTYCMRNARRTRNIYNLIYRITPTIEIVACLRDLAVDCGGQNAGIDALYLLRIQSFRDLAHNLLWFPHINHLLPRLSYEAQSL